VSQAAQTSPSKPCHVYRIPYICLVAVTSSFDCCGNRDIGIAVTVTPAMHQP